MGKKIDIIQKEMPISKKVSETLLRLPMYIDLNLLEMKHIVKSIKNFNF